MSRTQLSGKQVADGTIGRSDLDTTTVGQAVARRIIAGTGITLSSTGVESGTGDVTVHASAAADTHNTLAGLQGGTTDEYYHLSAADKTKLDDISGTNTGDQTSVTGNAGSATILQTGRTIGVTGDATGTSTAFNGSANVSFAVTFATVNGDVGSFGSSTVVPTITVNAKGLITEVTTNAIPNVIAAGAAGFMTGADKTKLDGVATGATVNSSDATLLDRANHTGTQLFSTLTGLPTTLAGYGISDATPSSHIGSGGAAHAVATTSVAGFLSGVDKTKLDAITGTNTGDQTTISGNAGSATILQTGRVISATGDATGSSASFNGSAAVSIPLVLATVNSNVGTFGSGTVVPVVTTNAKGLVTAVTTAAIPNVIAAGAAGFMIGTDKTKLDGIATGATANSADATLLNRANHTGTQLAATVSDFTASSRAQVEATVLAGANITITPAGSGATRTLTIAAAGGGGGGGRTFTFGGTGTPTAGTDKTPWLRSMAALTSSSACLIAKTAPSGGSLVMSILKSSDGGVTFPTTITTLTLTTGNRVVVTSPTTAIALGDLLRLDITSVNAAADWTVELQAA